MVKRQKNKLTKEKWDKNFGILKKLKAQKKNSIKEYKKREIMSPKNKIEKIVKQKWVVKKPISSGNRKAYETIHHYFMSTPGLQM